MKRLGISRGPRAFAAVLLVCTAVPSSGGAAAGDLVDTLKRIKAGVVAVGTYQTLRRPPARLLGTGFAVADGRYILTNAHVLPEKLDTAQKEHLAVFFGDDRTRFRARRVRIIDRDEQHDVALLRLLDGSLPALKLGFAENVSEGQPVAVTGFPLAGVLGFYPVTHRGIIAAIKPAAIPAVSSRQLESTAIEVIRARIEVYQLDITAFPGNSGSPVYDPVTGEVVGIVNSVFVRRLKKENAAIWPTGITYAIPLKYLRELLARNDIKG